MSETLHWHCGDCAAPAVFLDIPENLAFGVLFLDCQACGKRWAMMPEENNPTADQ